MQVFWPPLILIQVCFLCLRIIYLLWKLELERVRERWGKRGRYLSSTDSFPRWPQWPALGQAGTWSHELHPDSSIWVAGAQGTEPSSTAFTVRERGAELEAGAAWTQTDAHLGCWHCRQQLGLLCSSTGLAFVFLKSLTEAPWGTPEEGKESTTYAFLRTFSEWLGAQAGRNCREEACRFTLPIAKHARLRDACPSSFLYQMLSCCCQSGVHRPPRSQTDICADKW